MTQNNKRPFKKVILLGRTGIAGVPETLDTLYRYLRARDIQIAITAQTQPILDIPDITIITDEQQFSNYDLMIVVGGDGSLLNAAHLGVPYGLPLLGIHRGRLGFLTDIHPDHLDKIGPILNGHYLEESRFLLNIQISSQQELVHEKIALNDAVLLPGEMVHMIMFEIYINHQFVCNQRADGLIIATPTGSTAYALSGGGPILHPQLDAMVLVPMFPHTLSSRPIVIDGDSQVEIRISDINMTSAHVSCDGQKRVAVPLGGKISIQKKPEPLCLIHPEDYNYFQTLREKLKWENHILSV